MITAPASFVAASGRNLLLPIHLLEIEGYPRVFTNRPTGVAGHCPWMISPGGVSEHTLSVEDLDGGAALGELRITVQDRDHLITADFPGFTFEGKKATLKTGFPGMAMADFPTMFTGKIDAVPGAENNQAYEFICTENTQKLSRVIYTEGDDGAPIDNQHPRILNGHPLDIALAIMLEHCGMAEVEVNVARFERYRDEIFPGVQFYFKLTSAPEAREFLEQQILKPLGGYLWTDHLGRVTANFFYPLADENTPVMTLDRARMIGVPEPRQADLVNTVVYRMDKFDDKFMTETTEIYGPSEQLYGQYGQHIIEADGVRSSFQGRSLAYQVASSIFDRYGMKNLTLEPDLRWTAAVLQPGDLVNVTHPLIPNRKTGTVGVVNWQMMVLDRALDFGRGVVRPRLVDASALLSYGKYKIAPDAVPDWMLATAEQKARYMFISNENAQYSDGTAAYPLS